MFGFNREKPPPAAEADFIRSLKEKFLTIYAECKGNWKDLTPHALEFFLWVRDHVTWTDEEKRKIFPTTIDPPSTPLTKAQRKKKWRDYLHLRKNYDT